MWKYLVDLLHRANNDKALTAHERALRKAAQGALLGMLADAAPQLYSIMLNHAHFDWSSAGISALVGAFGAALLKLWLVQNSDPQIGAILNAYAAQKEREALDALVVESTPPTTAPSLQFIVPTKPIVVKNDAASQPTIKVPGLSARTVPTGFGAGVTVPTALDVTQQATSAMPAVNPTQS